MQVHNGLIVHAVRLLHRTHTVSIEIASTSLPRPQRPLVWCLHTACRLAGFGRTNKHA